MNPAQRTVLFVDDEPNVVAAMKRAQAKGSYRILTATSGTDALEIMSREKVDVIISDEAMPHMTGSELLARVSETYPDTIRIILTGQASLDATVRAINEGRIFRFLHKPCDSSELFRIINEALSRKEHIERRDALIMRAGRIASWDWNLTSGTFQHSSNLQSFLGVSSKKKIKNIHELVSLIDPRDREIAASAIQAASEQGQSFSLEVRVNDSKDSVRWISHTADIIHDLEGAPLRMMGVLMDITDKKQNEDNLRHSLDNLSRALRSTVRALGMTAEKRDPYTAGHQERVARLACAIAEKLDMDTERIEGLRVAGMLHDIGKISVPAELLVKPGLLSEFEMAIMKTHPAVGHEILKQIPFPWPVAEIVLQHHERMDGSGYPEGLKGEAILPEARILAVADVVEAMASHRPYRPSLGIEAALDELVKNKGILYDDTVANACLRLFREKGYQLE